MTDSAIDPAGAPTNNPYAQWLDHGIALGKAERYREAIAAFRTALQYNPQGAAAYRGLALSHEKLNENDLALQAHDAVTGLAPNDAGVWILKGELLQRMGKKADALAVFDWAAHLAPKDPHVWMKRGIMLGELGRREEAVSAFEKAAGLEPTPGALYNLAVAEARILRFEAAHRHMGHAKAMNESVSKRYPEVPTSADVTNDIEIMMAFLRAIVETPKTAEDWRMRALGLSQWAGIAGAVPPALEGHAAFPDDEELTGLLATFLRWTDRHTEARAIQEAAIARNPNGKRLWMDYATTLADMKEPTRAVDAYARVTHLDPNFEEAVLARAKLLREMGREREAIVLLEEWLRGHPDSEEGWNALGGIHHNASRFEEASSAYKRAKALEEARRPSTPAGPVVAYKGGRGLTWGEAIDDPDTWVMMAEKQGKAGEFKGALNLTSQALAINPRHARAWAVRGFCFAQARQFDEAKIAFAKALEIDPRNAKSWAAKGHMHLMEPNWPEAERALCEAIRLDPSYTAAYEYRGVARMTQGQFEGAIADFDVTLHRNNRDETVWFYRGTAAGKLGRWTEALEAYQAVATLKPRQGHAWALQGTALRMLGRNEEAIAAHEHGVRLSPAVHDTWSEYATTLAALGRQEEALRAADEAVRLEPNVRETHAARAAALRAAGREQEASAEEAQAATLRTAGFV